MFGRARPAPTGGQNVGSVAIRHAAILGSLAAKYRYGAPGGNHIEQLPGTGIRAGMKKWATSWHAYGSHMTVTVSTMFIPVHDPDAALGFYRDALGLEVRNDVASGGFRWVTVGAPGQDVDIVLSQPHGGRSQAEGDALLSLVTQGSLQAAIFRSDDLDTTFETVRASGAEVLQEPASQPWGARDCAVRDPSGNLVRIAQA
jgi:catechol 2,3-dioxygenase-like lactoylglutathione lyase family enzyme